MKNILAFTIAVLFSAQLFAMDMGLGIGYRQNDGDVQGATVDGVGTIQAGAIIYYDLTEKFLMRTGFMYTQRNYEVNNTDVELAYVDVPVTAMLKMEDYGGIFAGVNLGLNLSDDCGGSDCTEVESMILPITFGGMFKVAPQVALEVFYEMTSGELFENGVEDATAVGLNAMITFE